MLQSIMSNFGICVSLIVAGVVALAVTASWVIAMLTIGTVGAAIVLAQQLKKKGDQE